MPISQHKDGYASIFSKYDVLVSDLVRKAMEDQSEVSPSRVKKSARSRSTRTGKPRLLDLGFTCV